jgi:hypothetical protein
VKAAAPAVVFDVACSFICVLPSKSLYIKSSAIAFFFFVILKINPAYSITLFFFLFKTYLQLLNIISCEKNNNLTPRRSAIFLNSKQLYFLCPFSLHFHTNLHPWREMQGINGLANIALMVTKQPTTNKFDENKNNRRAHVRKQKITDYLSITFRLTETGNFATSSPAHYHSHYLSLRHKTP